MAGEPISFHPCLYTRLAYTSSLGDKAGGGLVGYKEGKMHCPCIQGAVLRCLCFRGNLKRNQNSL